ncbi:MAG: hypothetical protein D6705_13590 [Deltaproteobacteria bacterium]|nr:MAG: hypothetical protein D6705_13590 [Deltaproteobacteria bacterium]
MSTKKKPGTDLAALKARLAKKAGKAAPDVPPPGASAPPAEEAPAADVPPPGQVAEPAAEQAPDVPPPGQVADVPPPGQVAEPAPPPAAAEAPDEPFGGGAAFDPNAGLIDVGGDIATKSNRGLMAVVAVAGIGFGAMVGYLLHQISSKKELVEVGRKKGAEMLAEVQQVADARKAVALKIKDIKALAQQDPKKAVEEIRALLSETFEKHPKVDALFGWQLAAVHPTGVKKVFDLYEEANGLKSDLMYLAGFLETYGDAVKSGGPAMFGVFANEKGAKLVELVQPLCDLETKKPCEGREAAKAVGYLVRESIGAEPVPVPRGLGDKQVVPIVPDGQIFNYAVGMEPNKHAQVVFQSLVNRIEARLENMNKAEKIALTALKNYADSPTVDGDDAQPDPGGGA